LKLESERKTPETETEMKLGTTDLEKYVKEGRTMGRN
jgi:hypothetical protein